jgi:hypothetical protein
MRLVQIPQDHTNYLFLHLVELKGLCIFQGFFCR